MANTPEVQGLLAELGLGPMNEQAAYARGQTPTPDVGAGAAATQYAIAHRQGLAVGSGVGTLAGGVGGMFSRDGKPKQGFVQGMKNMAVAQRDEQIAKGMDMDVQTYRNRKATRNDLKSVSIKPTGDGIQDQLSYLKEVIRIANLHGDTDVVGKAMQKQASLRQQEAATRNVEGQADAQDEELRQNKETFGMTSGQEFTTIPEGANPEDEGFKFGRAYYDPAKNQYFEVDSKGNGQWKDHVLPWDTWAKTKGTRSADGKLWQTPVQEAKSILSGKGYTARGAALDDAYTNIDSLNGVMKVFAAYDNVSSIMSVAGDIANVTDKGLFAAEAMGRVISGTELGSGTYVDKYDGKRIADNLYRYNGQIVDQSEHRNMFLDGAASFLDRIEIPDYLRAQIMESADGANKYKALIMEMAYMDARMQEPSNRGLSDKDIEAALARIGAFTGNPLTFMDRQMELQANRLAKFERAGDEFPDDESNVTYNSKKRLMDATYPASKLQAVKDAMYENLQNMSTARERIHQKQLAWLHGGEPEETPVDPNESGTDRLNRLVGG